MLRDCVSVLQIELQSVGTEDWAMLDEGARCLDRREPIAPFDGEDPDHNRAGSANELMVVRAWVVLDPLFPNLGLGAMLRTDDSDGCRLTAVPAYVQEPEGPGA